MEQDDFDQWRQSPVGRWFFEEQLTKEIARRDTEIGSGAALSDDPYKTLRAYAELVGIGAGISFACRFDPFKEKRNEAKSDRPTPPH